MFKLNGAQFCTLLLMASSFPRQVMPNCFGVDDSGNEILVTDCVCDESCDECGFYGDLVSGPEDCYSCAAGLEFTELFDDGSGTCTDPAGGTEPEPLPEEEIEPETPPADDEPAEEIEPETPPADDPVVGEVDPGVCVMVFQMAGTYQQSMILCPRVYATSSYFLLMYLSTCLLLLFFFRQ